MKNRNQTPVIKTNRSHTVMLFGQAKLIQTAEGKLKLKGATRDERTEAKEFISLFMHDAVLSFA
ncbi:MAG: hypothetical protein WCS42_00650 [Verrucomicrobiota bacterium]